MALVAVVVAYITLYRQSKATQDQLDLMQTQLQNSITPVLHCELDNSHKVNQSNLTLTNGGSVAISDIRIYGKMSGVFNPENNEVTRHECQLIDLPLIERLGPGETSTLELFSALQGRLVTHLVHMSPTKDIDKAILAYTYVLRFRRQSDKVPFYRLIHAQGFRTAGAPPDEISYLLPLTISPNATCFSKSKLSGELRCRKEFSDICRASFALDNEDIPG